MYRLRSGFVVTSLEKFVFASHLRKPKIRNKACDFPKPITSQTLLTPLCRGLRGLERIWIQRPLGCLPLCQPLILALHFQYFDTIREGGRLLQKKFLSSGADPCPSPRAFPILQKKIENCKCTLSRVYRVRLKGFVQVA